MLDVDGVMMLFYSTKLTGIWNALGSFRVGPAEIGGFSLAFAECKARFHCLRFS